MTFRKELATFCPCCSQSFYRPQHTNIKTLDSIRIPVYKRNGRTVILELDKYLYVACKKCNEVIFEGTPRDKDYKHWIKGNARKGCPFCKKKVLEKIGEEE